MANQIRDLIASGRWQPGERLPTERELGETLSVGRSTIREALGALAALNVVRRERGGLYVNEEQPSLLPGAISATSAHEIFEARRLFEVDLAGLAAVRAEAGDLEEIGAWVPAHGEVPEVEEFKRLDVEFHGAVARAAQNRVVVELFEAVRGILFRSHDYYTVLDSFSHREARDIVRRILVDHERVYKSICAHQPGRSRDAMDLHFRHLEQWMLAHLPHE